MSPSRDTSRTLFWVWAALLLMLQVKGLGLAALFDVDEGAFSEATREMLASRDWGHTTLNGEPRFDKPILIYWLQAASVSLFGLSETTLRLPSALAAWGWAVATAAFAWPRWGLRAGIAAGSVLATCVGATLIGRAATADALLNLWLGLAALDLWRALEPGLKPRLQVVGSTGAVSTAPLIDPAALRRAGAWVGLGLLTKGPVALLVPGATLLIWLALRGWDEAAMANGASRLGGALRAAWRRLRPLLADPLTWALLLLIAVPWYAYALQRHGMAFVDGFILRHNLQRYGGSLEGHSGSWFYYVVLLPVLLFPWSALLLPVLARWRAQWAQPLPRYLLVWAGFVLVFFSGSGTKLPHYLLYGFTPLALLCGRALAFVATADDAPHSDGPSPLTRATRLARLGAPLLKWSLIASPLLAIGLTEVVRQVVKTRMSDAVAIESHYRALIGAAAPTWPLWLMAATVTLLAWGLNQRRVWDAIDLPIDTDRHAFSRAALSAALGVLFMTHALLPWWATTLQGPVRALALVAREQPATGAEAGARTTAGASPARPIAVQWDLHQPSFAVYYGQPCPRRAPQAGELALMRADQLDSLITRQGPAAGRWELVARQPGFVLIRWLSAVPA